MKPKVLTYLLLFLALFFCSHTSECQELSWAKAIGDPDNSLSSAIFSDHKGNLIVFNGSTTGFRVGVRKVDGRDGSTLWFKEFNSFFDVSNEIVDANGDIYFTLSNSLTKLDGSNGEIIWTSIEQVGSYAIASDGQILASVMLKESNGFEVLNFSSDFGFVVSRKKFTSEGFIGSTMFQGYYNQRPVLSYQFISDQQHLNEITFGADKQIVPHTSGLICFDKDLSVRWCIPATKLLFFNDIFFDDFGDAFVWGNSVSQSRVGFGVDSFSCGISDRSTLFKVDLGSGKILWHKKPNFVLAYRAAAHCDEKGRLFLVSAYTDNGNFSIDTTPEMRIIDPTACKSDQEFEVKERWSPNTKLYAFDNEKHFFALTNMLEDLTIEGVHVNPNGARSMILVKWNMFKEAETPMCGHKPIQVFPNPSKDVITFSIQESLSAPINIRIYDAIGRPQYITTNDSYLQLDISSLAPGLYIVEFTDALGQRERVKFIRASD